MSRQIKIKNDNNEIIKSGCVVLNDNDEVLLVSAKGEKIWTFPKGHVEKDETLDQTALREVEEETGYQIKILKRLSDVTYTNGKTGELIRLAIFKAKTIKKLSGGEKDIQSAWFSIEKARGILFNNLVFLLNELD